VLDPGTGVVIRLVDGTLYPAMVNTAADQHNGEHLLVLDRSLPALHMGDIAMMNLMYRVRAASDSVTLQWITDNKAEITMPFISVFKENTRA
jgi:hypothetical protein